MGEVSIGLAFLAGLASFLSPCVFSLIPAYIGYLSGRSVAAAQNETTQEKLQTFVHGLFFVLGFSLVFMTMGLTMSAIGSVVYEARYWLAKIGGVIVVVFGLHMTSIIRIPFLEYDLRPQSNMARQRGYLSSFILGISFSAGWAPCLGPIFVMILTLAVYQGVVGQGILLLAAYSLGLAIPFLIAALGVGWITKLLRKYGKVMHYIEIGMGIVLIIVGVLLFFGVFNQLSQFGLFVDFGL
jgi:cytochrome c-type biogenesis protein